MTPTPPIPGTFAPPPTPPLFYPTSIDALYQYKIFSRASAKAAGLPASCAPPFDSSRPVKNWLALDVDDTEENWFDTLDYSVQGATTQIKIPGRIVPKIVTQPGQAGTLNLPDDVTAYPPYVIAPVGVYLNDGGNELPVNNTYFCEKAEAEQMAALIGVNPANVTEYQPAPGTSGYAYVYASTETRRYWVFKDNDGAQQVGGIMLWQKNTPNGDGAPGNFTKTANGWEWFPAPLPKPVQPTGAVLPMPCRQFLAGESVKAQGMPTTPMLYGPGQ